MEFPRQCVTFLVSFVAGGFVGDKLHAVQSLLTLVAYVFSRLGEHTHKPLFGAYDDEAAFDSVFALADEVGCDITVSGPVINWLRDMLLPLLIERLLDVEFVEKHIEKLIAFVQVYIQSMLDAEQA